MYRRYYAITNPVEFALKHSKQSINIYLCFQTYVAACAYASLSVSFSIEIVGSLCSLSKINRFSWVVL